MCSHNLGIAYEESGNKAKALEYLLIALQMDEKRGDKESMVSTLTNIGILYLSLEDMDMAYAYLKRAVESSDAYGNPIERAHPYQTMGDFYVQTKEFDKAIEILDKALVLSKEYDQNLRSAGVLKLLGICRFNQGEVAKAVDNFKEAENLLLNTGEKQVELLFLYQSWANVYLELGDYEKSSAKANKGIALARESKKAEHLQNFLTILGKISEKSGSYKEAFTYHKMASELQDSLQHLRNEETILELDAKYQLEKKEFDNELLRVQQEKSLTELKIKNNYINFFLILATLFGIVAFLLYRAYTLKNNYNKMLQDEVSKRTTELYQSNIQLKKSNAQLERFAYIASHDLKTPIRNIISFTDLLERKLCDDNDSQALEYLSFIRSGGKRMNALVKDILDYSKLTDSSAMQSNEKIDLNLLCEEIKNTIYSTLEAKNAHIDIITELPVIKGNYSSMYIVFKNLIENAIKYNTSSNPLVEISHEYMMDSFLISVSDKGIGCLLYTSPSPRDS